MSKQTPEQIAYSAGIGAHISFFWASESTADAPVASDSLPVGVLGAASVGASTGAIYLWNGSSWKDTGALVKSFYGGTT